MNNLLKNYNNMIQNFLSALSIVIFISSIGFIAYYTSKIRKLEKNEKYSGFIVEVLLKGTINNDILPIWINNNSSEVSDSIIKLFYRRRNAWVLFFWLYMIAFVMFCILVKEI